MLVLLLQQLTHECSLGVMQEQLQEGALSLLQTAECGPHGFRHVNGGHVALVCTGYHVSHTHTNIVSHGVTICDMLDDNITYSHDCSNYITYNHACSNCIRPGVLYWI